MNDILTYAWLKLRGEVCWWLVRWTPIPDRSSRLFGPFCRLCGIAYFAGEVRSLKDWREYWRPVHLCRGGEPTS